MSAREQAKRDAEFDRLSRALINEIEGGIDNYTEAAIVGTLQAAYEMGKRHGRESWPSELLREIERERHIAMEGH